VFLTMLAAALAAVMRIDPQAVSMLFATATLGSGVSLPPGLMKFSDKVLTNRVGNMMASSTLKVMAKHKGNFSAALPNRFN
jgi:hypothetical protein